jgi:hypothetical protein
MAKKGAEQNPRRGKTKRSGENGAASIEGGSAAGPVCFEEEKIADELKIYWKSGGGDSFILQGDDGRWASWPQQGVVDAMRAIPGRMVAIKARENEMLSEVRRVFLWTRRNRCLDEIFPSLPGYKAGVCSLTTGERVLVKTEARPPVPVKGEWENIKFLIEGRLDLRPDGGIDQTPWFHAWCKTSYLALTNGAPGQWMPGHAMILAGPSGCGKNRLQEELITGLLGGRYANPAEYLFGGDDFNADVFSAEHLLLSEIPLASQKMVDRNSFMEKIKTVVANALQRMRLMRTEPWTVFPFWRLTISVNDNADSLRMLPLIVPGYGDKVLMFHCRQENLGPLHPGSDLAKRKVYHDTIAREIPAYVHWLLNEWEMPEDLVKPFDDGRDATRFGFREFHHPVLKGELFDETPAAQMMSMIDVAKFGPNEVPLWELSSHEKLLPCQVGKVWWERAETLQLLLTGEGGHSSSVSSMAKKLFAHNGCARLLAALAKDEIIGATRVSKADTREWKGWMIAKPPSV